MHSVPPPIGRLRNRVLAASNGAGPGEQAEKRLGHGDTSGARDSAPEQHPLRRATAHRAVDRDGHLPDGLLIPRGRYRIEPVTSAV